jgi:fatty acid-binding protein DegV
LNIKGVIEIDHSCGKVVVIGRAHGHARGVNLLFERFFDSLGPPERQHVAVLHGDARDEGLKLLERVRSQVNPMELLFDTTGPILGTHTGPGTLALAGYTD